MHVSTLFLDSYLRLMSAHVGPSTPSTSHGYIPTHEHTQSTPTFNFLAPFAAQPTIEIVVIRNGQKKITSFN